MRLSADPRSEKTTALWAAVQYHTPSERQAQVVMGACGRGEFGIGASGEDKAQKVQQLQETGSLVDSAMSRAAHYMDAAMHYPNRLVVSMLTESYDELTTAAQEAHKAGAHALGESIEVLAARTGQAMREIGSGAGDGFSEFWGFQPGTLLGGGAIIALLFASGAGYLLLTPAGQAYLTSIGIGAQSYMGGMGKAIGSIGVGGGKALAKL